MAFFEHEQTHRGAQAMAALANASVVVCGAGAIGANLGVYHYGDADGAATVPASSKPASRAISPGSHGAP